MKCRAGTYEKRNLEKRQLERKKSKAKLDKESAIVFGGSGGIGRVIADFFVSHGFGLTVAARGQKQIGEIEKVLSLKGSVQGFVANISVYEEVKKVVNAHVKKFGNLNVLVNTSAEQKPIGPLWENDPTAWHNTILTNLAGGFNVCHSALPYMLKAGKGIIILFSGGGAAYARPFFSAYGTSKSGVLRLVETVQEEIVEEEKKTKKCNIRLYAVAPGAVQTRMTEEIIANRKNAGMKAYAEALTVKEKGVPAEKAAELCLFLAEKRPKCLAGRLIHINEPYQEYVKEFEGSEMGDRGLLRRQGYKANTQR